jgi:hypothetical protein
MAIGNQNEAAYIFYVLKFGIGVSPGKPIFMFFNRIIRNKGKFLKSGNFSFKTKFINIKIKQNLDF